MKILLHICCGNCALYPVKAIRAEGNDFAGFWYNPNIHPFQEYSARLDSLKSLSDQWKIDILYHEDYSPEESFKLFDITDYSVFTSETDKINGLTLPYSAPPFRERCKSCYLLRLEKTAAKTKELGYDAFSTTLFISPYQDFDQIAATGRDLAEKNNVLFYVKDFRPYFRDSINLARDIGLYRQKYCGCIFSREEREKKKK
jgi:predicted adenine nucleotide alpha hydrolase (AANH) superfamily ATPase